MDKITEVELNTVLFPTPAAQLRYLRRLEDRYYAEFNSAGPKKFEDALRRLEAVEAAIRNFDPEAHAEALRARNMAPDRV